MTIPSRSRAATIGLMMALAACGRSANHAPVAVVPNDNRVAGGTRRGDTLVFALNATMGAWRPDTDVDSSVTVQAFAAPDGVPRIPGPLLRVATSTVVEIHVTNSLTDSTLVVHGLRPGTSGDDTLQVKAGESRTVHFVAGAPGTYLYWGRTSGDRMERSEGRDGPLAGAIVVDAAGVAPDTSERVFVITTLDVLPDTTRPEPQDDMFDLAVNGLSWPHTEALHYAVGDTVRWRWLNATGTPHPMHLHGFHFTALAKGDGRVDTTYAPDARRTEVTEYLSPGTTAQMRWQPTRAGNWLFHCHIVFHVIPFPVRPDSVRVSMADMHDASSHVTRSMSGLVMGIAVHERGATTTVSPTVGVIAKRLRLFAQQASGPAVDDTAHARGYALQQGPMPPKVDSINVPGPMLVLTRGQRTAITVINRLSEPTSVHWHGMELESYYDGVSGWSGADSRRAPMIAPGDSFVAVMTPPRAGTFMYHPHMEEEDQLSAGMFGPLIVMEPRERFDPATDLLFVIGDAILDGKRGATLNGARAATPLRLHVGTTYRLRFLNIGEAASGEAMLHTDSIPLRWRPRAKDGADLPATRRAEQASTLRKIGVENVTSPDTHAAAAGHA
ncbi:MAG: multicopper oxidase domain-containing protein [Gemmatimonadaceae bacterium]|nr:multicopper oxidase domain-containing protein [Gemmatimonadaceae bacterium]